MEDNILTYSDKTLHISLDEGIEWGLQATSSNFYLSRVNGVGTSDVKVICPSMEKGVATKGCVTLYYTIGNKTHTSSQCIDDELFIVSTSSITLNGIDDVKYIQVLSKGEFTIHNDDFSIFDVEKNGRKIIVTSLTDNDYNDAYFYVEYKGQNYPIYVNQVVASCLICTYVDNDHNILTIQPSVDREGDNPYFNIIIY